MMVISPQALLISTEVRSGFLDDDGVALAHTYAHGYEGIAFVLAVQLTGGGAQDAGPAHA